MFDSENYKKEWYKNNREIVLKKARYYRETHKDEIAKIKHICYERKKQEISNSGKKYYQITQKGNKFLEDFNKIMVFSESYGLG